MTTNHDADQLDLWLEATTSGNTTSPNGSTDQPPGALVAVAQRYHASLHAAEQRAAPTVPVRAIWEDVMNNTAPIDRIATVPTALGNGDRLPPASPPNATGWEPSRPGQWFATAALVAIAAIGILAVYATFFDGPDSSPPATGLPGIAFSSPEATPSGSAFWLEPLTYGDCTVEPLPSLREGELWSSGEAAVRDHVYLPITPADSPVAREVSATAREWLACVRYMDRSGERLETEGFFREPNSFTIWDPFTLNLYSRYVDNYQYLSERVMDPDPITYWVEAPSNPWQSSPSLPLVQTMLPSQMVVLPDGRVGGPLSWLIPPDTAPIMRSGPFQIIPFVILAPNVETTGPWLVDEVIPLCSGDCTTFWQDPNAAFVAAGLPAHTLSPGTAATPEAAMEWNHAPTPGDCGVPSAVFDHSPTPPLSRSYAVVGPADPQAAAAASRIERLWQACQLIGLDNIVQSLQVQGVRIGYSSESFEAYRERNPDALLDLLDPNPRHYVLPRPANLDPSSQSILLVNPANAVQFTDGRLGAPATELLPQWYIDEMTRLDLVPTVTFIFFAPDSTIPHGWVIDEIAILCPEGCTRSDPPTGLVTPFPASPAATPNLSQATVTCDVEPRSLEEISAMQQAPPDVPAREYGPTSPVSAEIAQQIAAANQMLDACRMAGEIGSMASPRLVYETRETGSFGAKWAPTTLEEFDDFVAMQQELSAIVSTDNPSDYAVETDRLEDNDSARLILPQNVVQLADGRVGGPVTSFYPSDGENNPYEYALVEVNIFTKEPTQNDRWVLDESLLMCVGDCDALFENIRADLAATEPEATPVASPAADEAWLQPITTAECTAEGLSDDEVSAIIRDPGDERETSYVPVGPADPEMARQAAKADRAWQACSRFGSIGQRSVFQTDQLTSQGPEDPDRATDLTRGGSRETIIARFDERRALGEAISGDWRDYIHPSEDAVTDVYDPAQFSAVTTLPWPEGAVELADGRIAIPLVRLVSPEDWESTQEEIEEGWYPYISSTVHILALDPETNAWVVDEVISLCVINCDEARAALIEHLDYQAELLGTPSATPVADPASTPAATDATQGDDAEEAGIAQSPRKGIRDPVHHRSVRVLGSLTIPYDRAGAGRA